MKVEVYYSPYFIDEHSPLYKVEGYNFNKKIAETKNYTSTTLVEIYKQGGRIVDVKDLQDTENSVRFIIEF